MTHFPDPKDECPGCGSSYIDRRDYAARGAVPGEGTISTELIDCPHCYAKKCCMCDMGDDVECQLCGGDEEE